MILNAKGLKIIKKAYKSMIGVETKKVEQKKDKVKFSRLSQLQLNQFKR